MPIINNQRTANTDQDCCWLGSVVGGQPTDEDINGLSQLIYVSNDADQGRIGLRWPLAIPRGATITACRIGVQLEDRGGGTFSAADTVKVQTWASDSVPAFNDAHTHSPAAHDAGGLSATEVTGWANLATGALFNVYESPDISALLQEVVNRAGWTSGNYFGVLIVPDGLGSGKYLGIADFEYAPANTEAYIYVDYTEPAAGITRSVTDQVLLGEAITKIAAHTLRDALLAADDDLRQTLHNLVVTDPTLLVEAVTLDGLTALITRSVTDGVLVADLRTSLLDRLLADGVFAAAGVTQLRDLRTADAMLLADTRRAALDRVLTDAILTADVTVKLLALVAAERLLLRDAVTAETTGGATIVTRLVTDTVLLAEAVARQQAMGLGDSMLLADAGVRELLLTLAERIGLVDILTAARGQDRTLTDTVLLAETVTRQQSVTSVDALLLATLATRVRALLWAEGLAITDTGAAAYLPPTVTTLTGIRVGVGDALGRTVMPRNLMGRTIGSLDLFTRRLGAARVGVA